MPSAAPIPPIAPSCNSHTSTGHVPPKASLAPPSSIIPTVPVAPTAPTHPAAPILRCLSASYTYYSPNTPRSSTTSSSSSYSLTTICSCHKFCNSPIPQMPYLPQLQIQKLLPNMLGLYTHLIIVEKTMGDWLAKLFCTLINSEYISCKIVH